MKNLLSILRKTRSLLQIVLHNKKKLISLLIAGCLLLIGIRPVYQYIREPSSAPENVKVTNITDQSLTISWTTQKPCFGFVFYSPQKYPFVILSKIPFFLTLSALYLPFNFPHVAPDDHSSFSTTHHATLKSLDPKTAYFYRVSTGYHIYKSQITNHPPASKQPLLRRIGRGKSQILPNIKTAKTLDSIPYPDPIYGQVVLERDLATPVKNALVYLSIFGANPISTYTDEKGTYVLNLSNLRTGNLEQIFKAYLGTEFNFSANAAALGKGKLTVKRSLMEPAPRILLKQNPP